MYVCVEEGVAGGQTGLERSLSHESTIIVIQLSLPLCVCVCVSSWIPDPFGSLFQFK